MGTPKPNNPWLLEEKDFPSDSDTNSKYRFLLQYAILAPSYQNTQPWKFQVRSDGVDVFANRLQWQKVADPDQRDLLISVGCAIENLLVAAEHFGFKHELEYFPDDRFLDHVAKVRFSKGGTPSYFRPKSLFESIQVRHTSHQKHSDRKVSGPHFDLLRNCLAENDIQLYFSADPAFKSSVDELLVRGNLLQFADRAYREEVTHLVKDGALGATWLISKLGELANLHLNRGNSESRRDSDLLMSSPAIGVLCSNREDRIDHVNVGQVYQRVGLLAASMGIWMQPMSHIIQVAELRENLSKLIPIPDVVPQHPFRLGFGEKEAKHTPRRPLDELLVEM